MLQGMQQSGVKYVLMMREEAKYGWSWRHSQCDWCSMAKTKTAHHLIMECNGLTFREKRQEIKAMAKAMHKHECSESKTWEMVCSPAHYGKRAEAIKLGDKVAQLLKSAKYAWKDAEDGPNLLDPALNE